MNPKEMEVWQADVKQHLRTLMERVRLLENALVSACPQISRNDLQPDGWYYRWLQVDNVRKRIAAGESTNTACFHARIARSTFDRWHAMFDSNGNLPPQKRSKRHRRPSDG